MVETSFKLPVETLENPETLRKKFANTIHEPRV
jgi:hypothetical protein